MKIKYVQLESDAFLTDFRNVGRWLVAGCASGRFDGEIFARVLDCAREARAGNNPAGLFMTLLKKELGYGDRVKGQK